MQNKNASIKILDEKIIYEGYSKFSIVTLQTKLFEGELSEPYTRELFTRQEAIGVIAYDPILDKLIFVEQFRMGAIEDKNPWLLEIVAGVRDKDEDLEELMQRELEEESGLEALDYMRILSYYSTPGSCSEKLTLFCAKVDSTKAAHLCGLAEENENICVHVLKTEDAFELLHNNTINNGITIIALQWLEANLEKVREKFLA